jgi:hypothetical protein
VNLTRSQLKTQYERAKRLGWIPHFVDAAKKTKGFFDVADLMAIGSRETNLDPKWLTKPGDHGNGFGLMQADKRSFPQFTKSEAWKDARQGILFGAEVLMNKWHDIQTGIGVKRGVYSSKSKKTSYFVGKDVGRGTEAQQVTIAAYNNGRWPHYAVTNGKDPDTYTTGKDYSSDVISRAAVLREWLKADGYIVSAAVPNSKPASNPDQGGSSEASTTEPPPDFTEGERPKTETNVNIDNAENVNVENKPLPKTEPIKVTVERVSIWSKVGMGIAAITGVGINFGNLVTTRLNDMTLPQLGYILGGVAIIGVGLWLYDRAARRAHEKTLVKMHTAADPGQTTVELREQTAVKR